MDSFWDARVYTVDGHDSAAFKLNATLASSRPNPSGLLCFNGLRRLGHLHARTLQAFMAFLGAAGAAAAFFFMAFIAFIALAILSASTGGWANEMVKLGFSRKQLRTSS